jgi:hypothetical protein
MKNNNRRPNFDFSPCLDRNEKLTWQGKPTFIKRLDSAAKFLRIFGCFTFLIFLFFILMGLVNRQELMDEGGSGLFILTVFIAISLLCSLGFFFFFPWLTRRNLANTEYAVTNKRAIIKDGVGQVRIRSFPINGKSRLEHANTNKTGEHRVLFCFPVSRRIRQRSGRIIRTNPMPFGFARMTEIDAVNAATALMAIKDRRAVENKSVGV